MRPKRQTITVHCYETIDGARVRTTRQVEASVYGPVAVHLDPMGALGDWSLTHVATGMGLRGAATEHDARKAARRLLAEVSADDWETIPGPDGGPQGSRALSAAVKRLIDEDLLW